MLSIVIIELLEPRKFQPDIPSISRYMRLSVILTMRHSLKWHRQ